MEKEISLLLTIIKDKNNIKCLLLKKNLCEQDKKQTIFVITAAIGDLSMLIYAHKNGFSPHENTTAYAAYNGHIACLKYAHENGFLWSEKQQNMQLGKDI